MRPFELDCDIDGEPGQADIRLTGYLDTNGVQRLEGAKSRILEAGACHVILDLEHLDYISSSGLGSLMALFQAVRQRKGNMVLLRPSRRVMDLLNLLGFTKLFPIAQNRADAGELLSDVRRT